MTDWSKPHVLWAAQGMMHGITVEESTGGYAVIYVDTIRGSEGHRGSASLTPEERKTLARALDPESYAILDRLQAAPETYAENAREALETYVGYALDGPLRDVSVFGATRAPQSADEYLERYGLDHEEDGTGRRLPYKGDA